MSINYLHRELSSSEKLFKKNICPENWQSAFVHPSVFPKRALTSATLYNYLDEHLVDFSQIRYM